MGKFTQEQKDGLLAIAAGAPVSADAFNSLLAAAVGTHEAMASRLAAKKGSFVLMSAHNKGAEGADASPKAGD